MAANRRFAGVPSLDKNILTINIYTIMKKNITIPALLLMLAMLMPLSASAYDFMVNNIYYNMNSDNTVGVTYKDSNLNTYSGSVTIPSKVTHDGVQYTVTAIGDHAFRNCPNLTGVTIPTTVKTIGYASFYLCPGLTSISIPNSVISIESFAFRSSGLTEVTIPNSVTLLNSQAFQGCTSLHHATLPEGLTVITAGLFYQCTSLESITIPEGVVSISMYAFRDCTSLAEINIPSSTLDIDTEAFINTLWLDNQPDGVVYAGKVAFTYKGEMPNGTFLTLRNDTRSIGHGAFSYWSGLVGITIPASVVFVGTNSLAGCVNLTTIQVESGNSVYDSRNNCNAIIEKATNTLIAGCGNSTIPTSVTAIGDYAFANCTSLHELNLHNQLTSIGEWAFLNCSSLTSLRVPASLTHVGGSAFAACDQIATITVNSSNPVYDSRDNCNAIIEKASNTLVVGCRNSVIPYGITAIGDNAFQQQYYLTHITIPATVNTIGRSSFMYTDRLLNVICEATTPPSILASSFYYINNENGVLYVPRASINAYSNDEWWSRFLDIRAIEDLVNGDIDDDGELSINDIAWLIDFLLNGERYGLNLYNADADNDGSVDISDVSRFIDRLLTQ